MQLIRTILKQISLSLFRMCDLCCLACPGLGHYAIN